ncbi:MAG: ABC transporter ATP-binding protein/permease [Anaerolineales bacterium]|nr:ABC transporter ATP-binding protein/permease [Anaerolineales bacterium]
MQHIAETSEEHAKDQSKVISRLLKYLRPYWLAVSGALVLVLINAGTQAMGPLLIGRAIDQFISVGDKIGLTYTMLMLVIVYFIGMLAMRYQIYLMSRAAQNVLRDLRMEIMEHVERLSIQFLEGSEAGDLMSRLVNDIDAINSFLCQGLAQSMGALFSLFGIVIAMFLLQWQLAIAVLAVVPVMIITTDQFAKMARRAFRRTRSTIGDVSADLQEELGGVKVAQAFNREDLNIRRFEERNAANRDANVSANAVTSAFAPAMDVLSTLDTAIVAGLGGYLAVVGVVTVGTVIAFLQYVQNFFRPIQTVAQIWTLAQSAFAAAERVFELFDTEPDIIDAPDAIEIEKMDGKVVFENATFGYDENHPVLHDISLSVDPGKTIAIVGPTGAGKTTLVSLILRFYDVTTGKVEIDDLNVKEVTQHGLRSQMSIVLQEPFLFSGTVMENIRYGKLSASDEEVENASKIANAHEFVLNLPEGYNTQVGERGGMLSQGQRQLISIARAVLADPRILILDEATASVDTRTEVLIQRALNRLLDGRTSFVIAHRLSTVRNADDIVVLDEGHILERGVHDELIERDGLYADLYQRQFLDPEDEKTHVEGIDTD